MKKVIYIFERVTEGEEEREKEMEETERERQREIDSGKYTEAALHFFYSGLFLCSTLCGMGLYVGVTDQYPSISLGFKAPLGRGLSLCHLVQHARVQVNA